MNPWQLLDSLTGGTASAQPPFPPLPPFQGPSGPPPPLLSAEALEVIWMANDEPESEPTFDAPTGYAAYFERDAAVNTALISQHQLIGTSSETEVVRQRFREGSLIPWSTGSIEYCSFFDPDGLYYFSLDYMVEVYFLGTG